MCRGTFEAASSLCLYILSELASWEPSTTERKHTQVHVYRPAAYTTTADVTAASGRFSKNVKQIDALSNWPPCCCVVVVIYVVYGVVVVYVVVDVDGVTVPN